MRGGHGTRSRTPSVTTAAAADPRVLRGNHHAELAWQSVWKVLNTSPSTTMTMITATVNEPLVKLALTLAGVGSLTAERVRP